MTALLERQILVADIDAAKAGGALLAKACKEAGISMRTYRRWSRDGEVHADRRPDAHHPDAPWKLSEAEQKAVLATCMEPRFADMPPTQIVPTLADEGVYLASESTFYRLLHAHQAQHHRGRAKARNKRPPTSHVATRPGQIWCWDVTYLPSTVRGMFFYLFAVIDLYSRKLVAWEVHATETGDQAAELIEKARWRERLRGLPQILHADNGAAQRSFTLRAKLQELGIEPSYSRPGVSDDNAFIESWFRTVKYMPSYPSRGFPDIDAAREWAMQFVHWYNTKHRHSQIGFVTPVQRHTGASGKILAKRRDVYEHAKATHPQRWSRNTRRWLEPDHVWLNPPAKSEKAALIN
jgi:transposase InsO family protein